MRKGAIPAQASFNTINPFDQGVSFATALSSRTGMLRLGCGLPAALVNNYGASGSNASIVITQATSTSTRAVQVAGRTHGNQLEIPILALW